jgi:hypothetical protein
MQPRGLHPQAVRVQVSQCVAIGRVQSRLQFFCMQVESTSTCRFFGYGIRPICVPAKLALRAAKCLTDHPNSADYSKGFNKLRRILWCKWARSNSK